MHKTELVEAIAKDAGLSRTDAGRAVESFISTVQKTLRKGDEVAITGFGKFSVAKRGARTGRNPQTGAPVKIRASKAPKFSAGATLSRRSTAHAENSPPRTQVRCGFPRLREPLNSALPTTPTSPSLTPRASTSD